MAKLPVKQMIEEYISKLPVGAKFTVKEIYLTLPPSEETTVMKVGYMVNHTKYDIRKLRSVQPTTYVKDSDRYRGKRDSFE